MCIEDVVESLNNLIDSKRKEMNLDTKGHFIIQRNIENSCTFKAIKTYTIILWYHSTEGNHKVLTYKTNYSLGNRTTEIIANDLEKDVCNGILAIVTSQSPGLNLDNILKGNLNGVPDLK